MVERLCGQRGLTIFPTAAGNVGRASEQHSSSLSTEWQAYE